MCRLIRSLKEKRRTKKGSQDGFIIESNLLETLIVYNNQIGTRLCIKLHNNFDQLTLQEQSSLSSNKMLRDKNLTKNAREDIISD